MAVPPAGLQFPALEHVPDAVVVADAGNHIRYVNPAVERLLGWTSATLVGRPLTALVPERLRAAHQAGFGRFAQTGALRRGGTPLRVAALRRDGGEVDIELVLGALPPLDGEDRLVIGVLRDVGERVALERELLVGRYLRATVDVTAQLQKAADAQHAFTALLPALCEGLDWNLAAIWQQDEETARLHCVERWHDGTLPAATDAMTRGVSLSVGQGLPGQVWSHREPMAVSDIRYSPEFPRARIADAHNLVTGLAFPLLGAAGPLGVVEFFSTRPRPVDEELLAVLASIGSQLGLFLERVRAETALRDALDALQTSLLPPHLPQVPDVELAAYYQAGRAGMSVGGDFYDVFPLPDRRWAFVIGDVCGKGAEAAAVTALARYTIRAAAMEHADPAEVLTLLNRALLEGEDARPFLTVCYLQLTPGRDGADASLAVAGHPLPLLVRTGCPATAVGTPGDLLGVLPVADVHPQTVRLLPGDTLLLYTDGLTEARDPSGRLLDESGLAAAIDACTARSADEFCTCVSEALMEHTAGTGASDDVAALVIRL